MGGSGHLTICVGIQVFDCLVFAADSAVTLHYGKDQAGNEIINVLPHGHKVFNLHRDLPICAMTSGLGNIGQSSISHLSKDFRLALMGADNEYRLDPNNYSIEEVAIKARKFFFEDRFSKLTDKPATLLNYHIGGYSTGQESPETWLVTIDGANAAAQPPVCSAAAGVPNIAFSGQPEAIHRLLVGVSMEHTAALIAAGLEQGQAQQINGQMPLLLSAGVLHAAMPVQDTIELAEFLVNVTKGYVRFLPGADTVGGDTDIAVVTKHEGFKWVKRKHYFSNSINPAEVSYGKRFPAEGGKPGQAQPGPDSVG